MTAPAADWLDSVLARATPLGGSPTVRVRLADIEGSAAVLAAWNFTTQGGSFGAADADAFAEAVAAAMERRLPLVTVLRSGGTRLSEGMRALVGIPRTALALRRLRAAGLAHVSVIDHPTMGGIWVAVGSRADVRIAVDGALVGFSGPRPILAMTGREAVPVRAAAAYDAGLVDAVVEPHAVTGAVAEVLRAVAPDEPLPATEPAAAAPADRDSWEQVQASRAEPRPDGAALLGELLDGGVALRGRDDTVVARLGRLDGRRVVGVALAGRRGTMPTPDGYALAVRAVRLAAVLDAALVVLVDTPGADPHTEAQGLAEAIATALAAVLDVPVPTVALVHGEGGSGGALAGAVTDVVGVGPLGWFAALGPEGAAATLRISPAEAAALMRVSPRELLADGYADTAVAAGSERAWLAWTLDRLRAVEPAARLARRGERWSAALPGSG